MMNIGIVCEGPTDYIILKEIIDKISGEDNGYVQLQPEPDLTGRYGNGWKGVWKWCVDNASVKEKLMKDIEPVLDLLVIQMDGDVSRKEKAPHCQCESTICEKKTICDPIECDSTEETRRECPVVLPCAAHEDSVKGYMEHLESLIGKWLGDLSDTCIAIPCDSIESWIAAAYDGEEKIEEIADPWLTIIAKKKEYHNIRIPGAQKRQKLFWQFAETVCANWSQVTALCVSAKRFEDSIVSLLRGKKSASKKTGME